MARIGPGTDTVAYTLTNPGEATPTLAPELGARFEDPIHSYDAVEVTLDRPFAGRWSGMASYRWSRLHGTFEGFYRDDNGQSDPGITSHLSAGRATQLTATLATNAPGPSAAEWPSGLSARG